MLTFVYSLVAFLIVILVIVFIHEYGHYFFAKLFKVKVEVFSIGFGKELFGFDDKNGTRWQFSAIPAGGYIKMFGDSNESSAPDMESLNKLNDIEKKQSLFFKPLYQKSLIAFGGPLANFLSAILIMMSLHMFGGRLLTEPVVTHVITNSVAERVGLLPGDLITKVEGKTITDFNEIAKIISINAGDPISMEILRDNNVHHFHFTPEFFVIKDVLGHDIKTPRVGIMSNLVQRKQAGFIDSFNYAIKDSVLMFISTGKVLSQIITGKRDYKELGGPIKIAQYSGKSLLFGPIAFLELIVALSINLAFINLLPIPVLDGGHIIHNIIEKIIGFKRAMKLQNYTMKVGMVLILSLLAFITINDFLSFFNK